ncbi:Cupredoxin [Chlamydoabsidia padenii]|nr:Cupredoxin [Chlamydoabsidia padenii]
MTHNHLLFVYILILIFLIHSNYCQPPPGSTLPPIDYFDQLTKEIQQPLTGINRTYYVAIDEVLWDYAPSGRDQVHDTSFDQSPARFYLAKSSTSIGTQYYKAQYREYTDDTYTTLKPIPSWQGGMGPILRAEVGDTLVVHVRNQAKYNYTMHPHGVFYDFEMEGAVYKGATEDSYVPPGGHHTYVWHVHDRAGPGPNDDDSLVWGYHSHMTEYDIYAGLYGAIIIYRQGYYPSTTTTTTEVVTTLFASDENLSPYLEKTMAYHNQLDQDQIDAMAGDPTPFYLSNVKQVINGLMLSSPSSLVFQQGVPVHWHMLAWGSFLDIHTVRWESGKVRLFGRRVTQLRLLPASFRTVVFTPSSSGSFGCLNDDLGVHGMMMKFRIE